MSLGAMLAIPSFSPSGILPTFMGNPGGNNRSPFLASIEELVLRFGTSDERRTLLRGLIGYRQHILSDGYEEGFQFINGSFVEDVESIRGSAPRDIDLMSFLVRPAKYDNNPTDWETLGKDFWTNEVRAKDRNRARFSVDARAVLQEETNFRYYTYWHSLFSEQRKTFALKGYLVVAIDPDGDRAALALLGRL